jgi:hypothetical protein
VDRENVRELGVPRMQSAKTAVKNIWNRVTVREENIKISYINKIQIN